MTNYGERPCQYDFGANLRTVIFEQGEGIVDKIKDLIIIAVNKWMPFVVLNDIQIIEPQIDNTLLANQIRVIRIKWVDGKLIKLALEIIASTRSKKHLKRLK